jgi:hypothetical protein
MEATKRVLLGQIMAGLAAGDQAYLFALCDHFTPQLRGVVRTVLDDFGRRDLLARPDDLHDLVFEVAEEIAGHASAWRPDGALPWRWADLAIRARLGRAIGHRTVSLDDERAGSVADLAAPAPSRATEYEALVAERADVQEFDARLRRLTSARDHEIVVEYLVQQAYGDPSPSHTVADQFGLGRPAVRQVVSRSLRRVRGAGAAC